MKRRKQNHKISFHFFAAPPCTPRLLNGLVRKFLVLVRDWKERARGAVESALPRAPRVRLSLELPRARRVDYSSKSCGFCSYIVRTSSKKHRRKKLREKLKKNPTAPKARKRKKKAKGVVA